MGDHMHEFLGINRNFEMSNKYEQKNSGAKIEEYQKTGIIDWKKMLKQNKGIFLEIGGPTADFLKDDIINFHEYPKLISLNIAKESSPQIFADACHMPFAKDSVEAIFTKKFRMPESQRKLPRPMIIQFDRENIQYIKKICQEILKVLRSGGFLVWLDLDKSEFRVLAAMFEVIFFQTRFYKSGERYQAVFVKK